MPSEGGGPERPQIHLPSPSAVPIVTCIGVAMVLAGLVPDSRLWRFAFVSVGAIIAIGGITTWVRDAIAEYRDLPE
ncbi:MAG TPA: hypothetical protein VMU66_04105 [Gaiellales bacterium]|nr:hypothetical protein [Gaiellales bacterium]